VRRDTVEPQKTQVLESPFPAVPADAGLLNPWL
jgi:hypothetical protein